MAVKRAVIFTFSAVFLRYFALGSTNFDPKLRVKSCFKQDGGCDREKHKNTLDGPCMVGRTGGLARIDAVKVGHIEEIDVGDKIVQLKTRSLKPPIFEIPNFLSDEECDYIIDMAKNKSMLNSIARGGLTDVNEFKRRTIRYGRAENMLSDFLTWDTNRDGFITTKEALELAKRHVLLLLKEEELLDFFHKVDVTELDDGVITLQEFETLNTQGIDDILYTELQDNPRHRHRYSEQTWLNMRTMKGNPLLEKLLQRLIKLTGLSKEIIYGSERIQVVRYTKHGHYHAHFDTETHTRTDVECCHLLDDAEKLFSFSEPCRICRYVTVLYYLNDVETGGETAFPVADNVTLDRQYMENSRSEFDHYNLNDNCKYSNVLVKPQKGTATLWYNHKLDETTGWLGEMDNYSLHGGCELHRGVKWIANNWITAPYAGDAHKKSLWLDNRVFPDDS